MPVAFQTISNTTYASRTDTTITAPTGIVNGDLLLMFFITLAGTEAPDPTAPAGFAVTPGAWPADVSAGGFNLEFRSFYKFASSESGDYLVTHATASSQGVLLRISGAHATAPFSPTPTLNANSGVVAEDTTATGLTTSVADCLIVLAAFDWGDTTNNLVPPTGSTPTFTERLDVAISFIATGMMVTAAATGDKTFANNSLLVNPWGASLLAIAPATGSPVPLAYTQKRMVGRAY